MIFIPTGDGMCISLINILSPYDVHINLALDILKNINEQNQETKDDMRKFSIRIGINENIDNLITDINGNKNLSGSGINYAARIEGLCDENQILVGNAVFDKLSSREKYMNAFISYTAEVKHGLNLRVHQYRNINLTYLNSSIPSRFKPKEKPKSPESKLTRFQAHYIASCISLEKFISSVLKQSYHVYPLHVLLMHYADDRLREERASKTNPKVSLIIRKPLDEYFQELNKYIFEVTSDLSGFYIGKYLNDIWDCFEEGYLFVNEKGKNKLQNDYPDIFALIKEFKPEESDS